MSVNVSYSGQCLIPLTVPFPHLISFLAEKYVIVCNSCCQIFCKKIKIKISIKLNP